jgi:putative methionine-R-sulfoxide reductase with GAF domain
MKLQTRLAISFTLLALLSSAAILAGMYIYASRVLREFTRQRLLDIASLGAMQIDADLHAALVDPAQENGPDYMVIKTILQQVRDISPDITYVYTMRAISEPTADDQIVFVVDAETDPAEISHLGDVYYEISNEQKQLIQTLSKPQTEDEFYTDRWGTWLTAYAPITNANGQLEAVLGVDMAVDDVLQREHQFLWIALAIFALLVPLNITLGWWLGKRLTRPISLLMEGTKRISSGDFSHHVVVNTKDELAQLASNFNSMTDQLNELVNTLEQRVADRTRAIKLSAEVSRRLSTIMEPSKLAVEVVKSLQEAFNYYHVHIYLFDDNREYLVMVGGTGEAGRIMLERGHTIPVNRGLVGRAAATGTAVLAPDTSQDPDWLPNPLLPETRAEIAVPILVGDEVLGALDVQQNIVNGLGQEDIELLFGVASQVAIALMNARRYADALRRAQREALTGQIVQQIRSTRTVESAMQVAVRELGRALKVGRTHVRLDANQVDISENGGNGMGTHE